jgi:hypothetical protein
MVQKIKGISNPLTIIAIFAGLAEVGLTVSLGLIDKELQKIFIWFLMAFPSLLVGLFFFTLYIKREALYSPKDFQKEESFLSFFDKYKIIGQKLELKSTDELPKINVQKTIVENLSYEFLSFLQQVANKKTTENDVVILMIGIKRADKRYTLKDSDIETHFIFGYLHSLFRNFRNLLFIINETDENITIKISEETLLLINKKLETDHN